MLSEWWKLEKKAANEGTITASMSMLAAISEVVLGVDARLKNIEETEKVKCQVAEERKEHKKVDNDEEHLVATRFYCPHIKQKSDTEIMRNAELQAMGLPLLGERQLQEERPQMATNDIICRTVHLPLTCRLVLPTRSWKDLRRECEDNSVRSA
ncbi:hypothetical protein BKA83DRAFT_641607 [Pisolithus microcarpus]|nr:hypothetical protein BKA83DRAFT_641607 [Pisolithus microcarpus]